VRMTYDEAISGRDR